MANFIDFSFKHGTSNSCRRTWCNLKLYVCMNITFFSVILLSEPRFSIPIHRFEAITVNSFKRSSASHADWSHHEHMSACNNHAFCQSKSSLVPCLAASPRRWCISQYTTRNRPHFLPSRQIWGSWPLPGPLILHSETIKCYYRHCEIYQRYRLISCVYCEFMQCQ